MRSDNVKSLHNRRVALALPFSSRLFSAQCLPARATVQPLNYPIIRQGNTKCIKPTNQGNLDESQIFTKYLGPHTVLDNFSDPGIIPGSLWAPMLHGLVHMTSRQLCPYCLNLMTHPPGTSVSLQACIPAWNSFLTQWLNCPIYLGGSSEPARMPGSPFSHKPECIVCKTAAAPCHQSIIGHVGFSAAGPLTTEAKAAWLISQLALAFWFCQTSSVPFCNNLHPVPTPSLSILQSLCFHHMPSPFSPLGLLTHCLTEHSSFFHICLVNVCPSFRSN